jgi:hypothetical protein
MFRSEKQAAFENVAATEPLRKNMQLHANAMQRRANACNCTQPLKILDFMLIKAFFVTVKMV